MFAIVAMIALSALSGCTRSSTPSPSYSMTATVGSISFHATNVYAVYTASTGSLAITANNTSSTYPSFSTVAYNYTAPATYTIDNGAGSTNRQVSGTYAPDATLADAKVAQTGTLTISSVSSTTVTGSFSFTCVDGTPMSGTFTAKRLW